MQNLDETKPTPVEPDAETRPVALDDPASEPPSGEGPAKSKKPRSRWLGRGLMVLLVFLVVVALGAAGGYFQAINDRVDREDMLVATTVADQFLLGILNYEHGEYELARQRFEYILKIDPGNAAASDKLTEVLIKISQSGMPTSTLIATATLKPTPDTRSQEELFEQALIYRSERKWNDLIIVLDSLRSLDRQYKTVEVDGLYYIAYRNRGLQRIQVDGNLEGGIFDLNLAENFGPLDIEASNYRAWADNYLIGVSYWGVDWEQVVYYLSLVVNSVPSMYDSSYFTAQDRLATAQVEYNLLTLNNARLRYSAHRYCDAYQLYQEASTYIQLSAEDLAKYEDAKNQCYGVPPTATPGTDEPTPTP